MNYLLAKIKNTTITEVRKMVENNNSFFNTQGIYVENIFQNVDAVTEIYFIAKLDQINNTKDFIEKLQSATHSANPDLEVAEITYLTN